MSVASRVGDRAKQIDLTLVLLSLLALPLVLVGRFAYGVVAATRWVVAAVVTGYEDARGSVKPSAG